MGVKAHSSLDFKRYTSALFVLCICCSWYNFHFKHLHEYKQAHIFDNVIMHGHVNTLYCDVSRIFYLKIIEMSLKALQTGRQTM